MPGRPVAVPVLAKLVIKGMTSASRLWLSCRMAQMLAAALACRDTRVVADAAITCLWYGPSVSGPIALGILRRQAVPPAVSAPDGHGMILIERRVDIETRHIVLFGRPGRLKNSGP